MGCSPKRFSRPPRCDRFDTPPCPSIISVFYAPVNRLIRARSCFVLRRDFPLFPACFLLPPICRNAFAHALNFFSSFPRPFRFLSPPCSEVRSFALRFVPPLLAAFSRARKRAGAFCCPRTNGESLRAKKTAPLTDQEITLAAKNKTNPRIGQIRQYRGICRQRAGN